ncbi:hypothetical protein EUTSA_v10019667mg [Eutrema salsugineum]|uniref:MADS-box domain-containing protein n=1 Tax=Eutrema salsugineum TaxID=72664 RepID=V4KC89_EUTSA|nr:agamous-like MADS-box protein AGL80 [Eutrema salsugineum]ESQ28719.1 hypothetical protein EUTSA_v10019667mg [Eutrema salsugineum]
MRKKVKLAFIENNSSRKAPFQKRKKGLLKKVKELSTLYGVTACVILYSPNTSNPDVWPSNSGVQRVVLDFQTLPEMDQHKKMLDQETFLRQRITKLSENLRRLGKDNREQEMIEVMFQCWDRSLGRFHLNILDLNDLGYVIDQYQRDINHKIEILGSSNMEMGESSNTAVTAAMAHSSEGIGSLAIASATTAPAATIHEVYSSSSSAAAATFFNSIQQQQHHHQHQQFRHPATPHVGFYEQTQNMNLNQIHNEIQHQHFMEMMNHPDQMSYEHMYNRRNPNHHNPFHHHQHQHHYLYHQQQQQLIASDSSTALTTVSSSSIIHVTSKNPTNNTWFY